MGEALVSRGAPEPDSNHPQVGAADAGSQSSPWPHPHPEVLSGVPEAPSLSRNARN